MHGVAGTTFLANQERIAKISTPQLIFCTITVYKQWHRMYRTSPRATLRIVCEVHSVMRAHCVAVLRPKPIPRHTSSLLNRFWAALANLHRWDHAKLALFGCGQQQIINHAVDRNLKTDCNREIK